MQQAILFGHHVHVMSTKSPKPSARGGVSRVTRASGEARSSLGSLRFPGPAARLLRTVQRNLNKYVVRESTQKVSNSILVPEERLAATAAKESIPVPSGEAANPDSLTADTPKAPEGAVSRYPRQEEGAQQEDEHHKCHVVEHDQIRKHIHALRPGRGEKPVERCADRKRASEHGDEANAERLAALPDHSSASIHALMEHHDIEKEHHHGEHHRAPDEEAGKEEHDRCANICVDGLHKYGKSSDDGSGNAAQKGDTEANQHEEHEHACAAVQRASPLVHGIQELHVLAKSHKAVPMLQHEAAPVNLVFFDHSPVPGRELTREVEAAGRSGHQVRIAARCKFLKLQSGSLEYWCVLCVSFASICELFAQRTARRLHLLLSG
mmetsp:Transcript_15542/g.49584  ORF Transcript_15542/g.49584 Transcript_15542/m.49584 type:complete len:380 (+) Transcript_15542:498-1637(+)